MGRGGWTWVAAALLVALLPFAGGLATGLLNPVGMPMNDAAVSGDADTYQGVWHHWWVSRALFSGADPRFCPIIYHPVGASLVYDSVGWVDCILLAPLSRLSPPLAYNTGLFLNSILVLAGVYLLARNLGSGRPASLLAALMAVWLPARVAHVVQHYQVAAAGWTFLSLAFCASIVKRRNRALRPFALASVCALLALLQSPYHFLMIIAGLAMLPLLIGPGSGASGLLRAGAPVVLGGMAGMGFILLGADGGSPGMPWREAIHWAAEPQSFLLPSPFGLLGGFAGMPARTSWMPNVFEGVVTPGLAILFASVIGMALRREWRIGAAVGILFLLALGPQLKIFGRLTPLPLPYRLVQFVPGLAGARAASRFAILGGALLCIPAGRALTALGGWKRAALSAAIVLETLPLALPTLPAGYPEEYRVLAESGPTLELPASWQTRRYLYLQTIDGNPRFATFMARPPEWSASYRRRLDSLVASSDSPQALADAAGANVVVSHWLMEDELAGDSVSVFTPGGIR